MRVRAIFKDIPPTLTEQLQGLVTGRSMEYSRALEYVRSSDFARARGFLGELTEEQLMREMREVICQGAG